MAKSASRPSPSARPRPLHRRLRALVVAASALLAGDVHAWPQTLAACLLRDARKIVPRSLARLIADREKQVLEEIQRFPAPLGRILAEDLSVGELTPETVSGLVAHVAEPIGLFQDLRVSDGIVRLGATLRVPADLSDPILTVGPEGYPPGLAREYYAFIEGNLDKLPVVLDDAAALKLARSDLPVYWRSLMVRSRADAPLLRAELFKEGRIVSHRALDYRSPVFAVAQVAYSRAVTGIAATWLAVWREARGDMTRMRAPVEVRPVDPSEAGGTP